MRETSPYVCMWKTCGPGGEEGERGGYANHVVAARAAGEECGREVGDSGCSITRCGVESADKGGLRETDRRIIEVDWAR